MNESSSSTSSGDKEKFTSSWCVPAGVGCCVMLLALSVIGGPLISLSTSGLLTDTSIVLCGTACGKWGNLSWGGSSCIWKVSSLVKEGEEGQLCGAKN
jgi:hypothetical protein